MSKENPHNNFIVSLDSFIKYIKGNLLGDKKKEVDLHLKNSPLFQDAAEGLSSFKKPDKLPDTVDELNKQIALKIGTTASQTPSPKAAGSSKVVSLNLKAIGTISAAATVIVACGLGIYYGVSALNESSKTAQVAVAEVSDEANEPKGDVDFRSFNELKRQDSVLAEADSTAFANGADTVLITMNGTTRDDSYGFSITEDEESLDANASYNWSFGDQGNSNVSKEKAGTYKLEVKESNGAKTSESLRKEYESEEKPEPIESIEEPEFNYTGNAESLNNTNFSKNNKQITTAGSGTSYYTDSIKQKSEDKKAKYRSKDKEDLPEPYETAVNFLKKGDTKSAQKEFEKVLNNKKSPFYDDAAWQLANIYLQQGESKKAKKMLKKVDGTTKYGEKAKKLLEGL